jgi:hypothetical protein
VSRTHTAIVQASSPVAQVAHTTGKGGPPPLTLARRERTWAAVEAPRYVPELKVVFSQHEAQHEREKAERRNGRRWLIGTAFAGLGSIAAIFAILIDIF